VPEVVEDAGGEDDSRYARACRTVLAPHPRSANLARNFVDRCCLDAGVGEGPREVAVLLTSEAVTNAVIHARSETRLAVLFDVDSLRVEVGDDEGSPLEVTERGAEESRGRGLAIMELLADGWGIRTDLAGKIVWFRVRTG
jgi:anti-sigma regulatory factor (Ser/Thr protein kinase)